MTPIAFKDYPREPVVVENLSEKMMRESRFVPLELSDGILKIAMVDPEDFYTIDALRFATGLNIEVYPGKEGDILDAVEKLHGAGTQSLETIIEEARKDIYELSSEGIEDADHLRDLASEAPIIRLVNRLIFNAVEQRASDIHFEPFEREFKARYRIDGVLHDVESPPKDSRPPLFPGSRSWLNWTLQKDAYPRTEESSSRLLTRRSISAFQRFRRSSGKAW